MGKISYVLKRVKNMQFKSMFEKIDDINKKTGKAKISTFLDMVYCGFKYQAGYMDYWLFEMYNLNKKQRETIVTRGINNSFMKKYNNEEFNDNIENKANFNKLYAKYLKRKWLDLNNATKPQFEEFVKGLDSFMLKPDGGMCGKGIEKIDLKVDNNIDKFWNRLKEYKGYILEEVIKQNEILNKLHPNSINTCRVISLRANGKINIVATYLRIGNGKYVDNFNSGGMVVPVNKETGIIEYPALDKAGNLYKKHPLTGVDIVGFKVPQFEEALNMVKEAGEVIPEVGLVGWDVGFSVNGPLLVEANDFAGHDIYQLPPHRTNGIGMLPEFEKIIYPNGGGIYKKHNKKRV